MGDFLVKPEGGLMVWTLLTFGIAMYLLGKLAFPRIQKALDERQRGIEESIEHAERTKREADELLQQYRDRLHDAREQADEIVTRARRAAEEHEEREREEARRRKEELMEQTRREIDQQTRRAIQQIRSEVADLTVAATEKVTRKVLTEQDQRRLVDEALGELDFEALTRNGGGR